MIDHNEALRDEMSMALKLLKDRPDLAEPYLRSAINRLAQAPHVPVSLDHIASIYDEAYAECVDAANEFHSNTGKPWDGDSPTIAGLKAIHALQLPQPDKIAGQSGNAGVSDSIRTVREWVSVASESKAMSAADLRFTLSNAAVELTRLLTLNTPEAIEALSQKFTTGAGGTGKDWARAVLALPQMATVQNGNAGLKVVGGVREENGVFFLSAHTGNGYEPVVRLSDVSTSDTSKIDTPAEVGEGAKKRFDELTTGDNPYPYEWRSFYNGYLEGAFRRREESTPGEVRTGGLAEHGPQTEADHLISDGELSGLPVEDQVRLYLRSGGSVAGSEALRTKLTTSKIDAAVEALIKLTDAMQEDLDDDSERLLSEEWHNGWDEAVRLYLPRVAHALAAIRSAK